MYRSQTSTPHPIPFLLTLLLKRQCHCYSSVWIFPEFCLIPACVGITKLCSSNKQPQCVSGLLTTEVYFLLPLRDSVQVGGEGGWGLAFWLFRAPCFQLDACSSESPKGRECAHCELTCKTFPQKWPCSPIIQQSVTWHG